VQVLPSRNASSIANFNPFFEPPAPDPPRNLPPIIRAGTVIPPIPSATLQEDVPHPMHRSFDASVADEEGVTKKTVGLIIGAVVLSALLCVLCGVLWVMWQRRQSEDECFWKTSSPEEDTSRSLMLKKQKPWEAVPLVHTTHVDSVSSAK
jgi:hypothetical protein